MERDEYSLAKYRFNTYVIATRLQFSNPLLVAVAIGKLKFQIEANNDLRASTLARAR